MNVKEFKELIKDIPDDYEIVANCDSFPYCEKIPEIDIEDKKVVLS
jgi:hypothetical protein